MKRIFLLFLFVLTGLSSVSSQNTKAKKALVGRWLFEAPYAPQGYTSGTIEVGFAEKKYSATMTFNGNENKTPANIVKFKNDTLYFSLNIEGQDVSVILKFDEKAKMSGKAIYTEGEVPLSLIKEKKKK